MACALTTWLEFLCTLGSPQTTASLAGGDVPAMQSPVSHTSIHRRDRLSVPDVVPSFSTDQSQEEWENASMFLVEQDMAAHNQLFSPTPEMPDNIGQCFSFYDDNKVRNHIDSPVDIESHSCPENYAKDIHALDTSSLPITVSPAESALQLSRRLYQYTKQHQEYEGQTARMLSANGTPFLQEALTCYLERFHFEKYPIDMALRQFLSLEHLPLESQQVDRVLVAFSHRYHMCNPDILDEENVYLLVYSLLLLHTDAFHKSVRPRISKAEFVSMTEASRVHHAILEYLYDNTSLVEFAYMRNNPSLPFTRDQDTLYKLLSHGNILYLQQDPKTVQDRIQMPFCFAGIRTSPRALHNQIMNAPLLEFRPRVSFAKKWAMSQYNPDMVPLLARPIGAGVVKRCDSSEGDKRSLGTKWKPWGMIITGSALLWCKNPDDVIPFESFILSPHPINVRVDEVTPLCHALCVYNAAQKDKIVRLRVNGRWYLIQVQDEQVEDWVDRINYIASLGSCALVWDDALMIPPGVTVQMRPMSITVLGPLRTGAQPGNEPQPRHMYMECMKATSLALAQSVLSISLYLASHRQRYQTLAEEHQRQVQTIMHMGLLTPLQRSTRDNLMNSSTVLSQSLRRTQIELTFLSCRIHFLQAEQNVLHERLQQEGLDIYTPV